MRMSDWSSDVCSSDLRHVIVSRYVEAGDALQAFDTYRPHADRDRRHELCLIFDQDLHGFVKDRKAVNSARVGYLPVRSEERRGGKECVSTCRCRWSPSP